MSLLAIKCRDLVQLTEIPIWLPCYLISPPHMALTFDLNTNTHAYADPQRMPGVSVISCLDCCLGLCVVENVLRKEETLAPNRTGNLISPSLSSSINLPSGTGTINKDRTLCDTLTGQMGVRGGELRPSASTRPYSWQNWTATPGPILNFLCLSHTQTHKHSHIDWDTETHK